MSQVGHGWTQPLVDTSSTILNLKSASAVAAHAFLLNAQERIPAFQNDQILRRQQMTFVCICRLSYMHNNIYIPAHIRLLCMNKSTLLLNNTVKYILRKSNSFRATIDIVLCRTHAYCTEECIFLSSLGYQNMSQRWQLQIQLSQLYQQSALTSL